MPILLIKQNIIKYENLLSYKNGQIILTFGDNEIEKNKSNCYKSLTFKEDVDIEKV